MDLILDASNIQYRSFFIGTSRNHLSTRFGFDTGGIYIFLNTLHKLVEDFKPDRVWACWDKKLIWPSSNFRKDLLKGTYKAHREKEPFQGMFKQEDFLFKVLNLIGCRNMHPRVLEADDVVSWLSKKLDCKNLIVSSDQDLFQLVSEKTNIYTLSKKKVYTVENFEEEVGIALNLFVIWKAIQGDKSDNIEGIKGYGKKKAVKVASQWPTIDSFTEDQIALVERNIKAIDLTKSWEFEKGEEDYYLEQYNNHLTSSTEQDLEEFKKLCQTFEFNTYLKKFDRWVAPFRKLK